VYSYCINSNFKCPNYGHSWSCPPAAPFLKEELSHYNQFYLIFYKFDIKAQVKEMLEKNPTLTEEKIEFSLLQKNHVNLKTNDEIDHFINEHIDSHDEYIIIWPEKCKICLNEGKKCTYKKGDPCRYPEELRYSMTGAGINTHETVKNLNFELEWPPINHEYRFGLACLK